MAPRLTIRTLKELLDVRMDHVAEVDFAGFVALADRGRWRTGRLRLPQPIRLIRLSRGVHHPQRRSGAGLCAERKGLPRGDLDRAERQRSVVIPAILAKGLSGKSTIGNPRRFIAFTSGVARHITVDAPS